MSIVENEMLTPRESVLLDREAEENRLNREHAVRLKELEIQLARDKYQAQIELKKLESKWSSLLRIPSLIIKLPVLLILSIGFIFAALRKWEPSKSFWSLF